MRIAIRVQPRARRTELQPLPDSRWLVRVTAPPTGGQANAAVCAFLADLLGVPRRAVTIVGGRTSREKLVEVAGLDEATGLARLRLASARGADASAC